MSQSVFRAMPQRLSSALELLRRREVPPFDESRLAQLRPHQQVKARQMREEHAKRVQRARQRTTDPAFEKLSRADWQWLQDAHLIDLFTATEGDRQVQYVQLTVDGRRTYGYVDHSEHWAERRRETAATAEAI